MADQVSIRFPAKSDGEFRKVFFTHTYNGTQIFFIASGTAKGTNISSVRGVITDLNGNTPDPPIYSETLFFVNRPRPQYPAPSDDFPKKFRWMIRFYKSSSSAMEKGWRNLGIGLETSDDYLLKVIGLHGSSQKLSTVYDEVQISIQRQFLDIGYPDADYTIDEDEKAHFLTYGATSRPILCAELGNQLAETIYDDTSAGFWSAQFQPLTSSGEQFIQITDVDNNGADRRVIVD